MKIKVKRRIKYTLDNRNVDEVLAGEYEVPRQVDKAVAHLLIEMGKAVIIPEPKVDKKEDKTDKKKPKLTKKAPENKVMKVKESK